MEDPEDSDSGDDVKLKPEMILKNGGNADLPIVTSDCSPNKTKSEDNCSNANAQKKAKIKFDDPPELKLTKTENNSSGVECKIPLTNSLNNNAKQINKGPKSEVPQSPTKKKEPVKREGKSCEKKNAPSDKTKDEQVKLKCQVFQGTDEKKSVEEKSFLPTDHKKAVQTPSKPIQPQIGKQETIFGIPVSKVSNNNVNLQRNEFQIRQLNNSYPGTQQQNNSRTGQFVTSFTAMCMNSTQNLSRVKPQEIAPAGVANKLQEDRNHLLVANNPQNNAFLNRGSNENKTPGNSIFAKQTVYSISNAPPMVKQVNNFRTSNCNVFRFNQTDMRPEYKPIVNQQCGLRNPNPARITNTKESFLNISGGFINKTPIDKVIYFKSYLSLKAKLQLQP